jgi:hypothetical protein
MNKKITPMEWLKRMQPTVDDSLWCLDLLEDKMVNAVAEQQDFAYRVLLLRRIREEIPDFVSQYSHRFD